MISDYTLGSLLNTSLGLNWLDFEQEMTGEALSNYIDHFDTAFGARTKVKVIARPVKGTQKLKVADRDTIVTFNVDVNIRNPFASEQRQMDTVRASVEVTA